MDYDRNPTTRLVLLGGSLVRRKIVTHKEYSFYNPKQHPYFDKQGGRVIFFEGTYTTQFSGNVQKTPRYNYNQIMYTLDLAHPDLRLPEHRKAQNNRQT